MRKKLSKIVSFFVLLVALLITSSFISIKAAGYILDINSKALYNNTNTYEYLYDQSSEGFTKDNEDYYRNKYNFDARYNLNKKTSAIVDDSDARITVFTHGWNASRGTWSIDDRERISLVTRLQNLTKARVYVASFKDGDKYKFSFTEETEKYAGDSSIENRDIHNENLITDFDRNIIVIFEAYNSGYGHDYVYTQFNYMMSLVLNRVKDLNEGKLPKVNLIGHSRGGLTNIQYALDHPELVDNIFSFGTPYIGTTTAELDVYAADKQVFKLINPDAATGEWDLADPNAYMNFVNRWNNGYDKYYSNIDVLALGGIGKLNYVVSYLGYLLNGKIRTGDFYNNIKNALGEEAAELMVSVVDSLVVALVPIVSFIALNPIITGAVSAVSAIVNGIIKLFTDEYSKVATVLTQLGSITCAAINLLIDEVDSKLGTWNSDFAVNIGSQMARRVKNEKIIEYKGFESHYEVVDSKDLTPDRSVHENEVFHPALQNMVLNRLVKSEVWAVNPIAGTNEAYITGYFGDKSISELKVPAAVEFNGSIYNITGISDFALSNNVYDSNITSIVLPETLTTVGAKAFANSDMLENVDFSNATKVDSIGSGAFANDSRLCNISLPNSVTTIGEDAFVNDSGLREFAIPANTNYIGEGAFTGTSILSFKGNKYYNWSNNLLIEKSGATSNRDSIIYANPYIVSFNIPDSVTAIKANAFRDNDNVRVVNLNNVEVIGANAFTNSTLETLNGGSKVNTCELTAFTGTSWINNFKKSDYIAVGSTLLAYLNDSDVIVVPEGITNISANCFYTPRVNKIILPESLEMIGEEAFKNCLFLQSLVFTANEAPLLDRDCFSSNVEVLVPEGKLAGYKTSMSFKTLPNKISPIKVSLSYYDEKDNFLGTWSEYYGSILDNYGFQVPTGYEVVGFVDSNGNSIKPNQMVKYLSDENLTVKFKKIEYTINLSNGGTPVVLVYGEKLNVQFPTKAGYNFLGWYDASAGGNLVVDSTGVVKYDKIKNNVTLYPRYQAIVYTITYSYPNAYATGSFTEKYSADMPLYSKQIPSVYTFGDVFKYWVVKDTNDEFDDTTMMHRNITLVASWKASKVNINSNTNIIINEQYNIVDLTNVSAGTYHQYVITNQAKVVTFIGNGSSTYTMNILVENRSNSLLLGLKNISFKPKSSAGEGLTAIKTSGSGSLFINYLGNVVITGGTGANGGSHSNLAQETGNRSGANGKAGGAGYNGGAGINAYYVALQNFDNASTITVIGGNGGNGGAGQNGQQGSNGVKAPSGNIFKHIKGDNGARGGDGGAGGAGGDGGKAIIVNDSTKLKRQDNADISLVGGNGGAGGDGGAGGAGGKGASDTSSSWWKGVGDPGDGGNGGNGARGGAGGYGPSATNATGLKTIGGVNGAAGANGAGGAGGAGGSAGKIGKNGRSGSNGLAGGQASSSGARPVSGAYANVAPLYSIGYVDNDTTENSSSVKNYPNMFSEEFLESQL